MSTIAPKQEKQELDLRTLASGYVAATSALQGRIT
jgi:hypothetical protein